MIMVAMLCGFAAMAQSPGTLSCGDVTATAGGETAYLEVKLATEDVTALSGIQFNFTLPEGVTIAQYKNEDEEMEDDVTFPIAKSGHQVGIKAAAGGGYLVYLGGETSLSFKTSTDVVARIGLKVAKTVTDGTYNINFVNVKVSDKSTPVQSYDVPDFTAKLTVTGAEPDEDTDISKLDNVIYLEKMEGCLGSTATLSFKMKNTAAIRAFQFDLYLPEGVTPVKDDDGEFFWEWNNERLPNRSDHALEVNESDGYFIFLDNSFHGKAFTGSEGEIFTLKVAISENMNAGDYPVIMKEITLVESGDDPISIHIPSVRSTLTIMSFKLGDVNGDNAVDVTDYVGIANHILEKPQTGFNERAADINRDAAVDVTDYVGVADIILQRNSFAETNYMKPANQRANVTDVSSIENVIYIEPQTLTAGTQGTLSFHMKNTAAICGFQFHLYLPEGITPAKEEDEILCEWNRERLPNRSDHALMANESNGYIIFLGNSYKGKTFTGNEGELFTLTVDIAADMENGDYPIVMKNMKLQEPDMNKFYIEEVVESTVTVVGGVGIADILEDSNTPAVIYNLSGQRLAKPQHGLNIVNGKKIIIK